MKNYYITTPIYYVNDKPHIGHAYTTIAADVLARYHRLSSKSVHFLIGTDENAQKNVESAPAPDRASVQKYVDDMSAAWKKTWEHLDITHDDFIRTSEDRHKKTVEKFWNDCLENGDIYKDTYEGLYCTGCEGYKTEQDLIDGLCPDHKREPEKLSEENYFFRFSKYQDQLLEYFKKHPDFIQPKSRRNEVIAFVKDHAKDFSISRKNSEWGIPVPGDDSQTIYVWFDALINYISALGYGAKDQGLFEKFWPASLHLVGKDIIKFHCAYWPAMLLSAGVPLPKTVYAHGFFTVEGQKMSKTIGNVVDPIEIADKYGNDVLRYYLLKEITFGEDGDFSIERLKQRYSAELANELGNLVMRATTLFEKAFKKPQEYAVPKSPPDHIEDAHKEVNDSLEKLAFHQALDSIWKIIRRANVELTDKKPWEDLDTTKNKKLVLDILADLHHVVFLLSPFLPETSEKIRQQITVKASGDHATIEAKKGEPLFPRLA